MVIEERIYTLQPGVPVSEFLKHYESIGLPVQKPILKGFLGYFVNEFGVQNQVIHLWAYTDLEDRRRRRAELAKNEQWQECIAKVRPMIASWENKIMYPTSFSPIRQLPVASDDADTAFTFTPE